MTPAQDRMYTAAFDLTTTSRDELIDLLRRWTTMSARLTAGLSAGPYGPTSGPYDAPPDDTGEALGPAAGRPHDHDRLRALAVRRPEGAPADRFGLADRLPPGLVELPHFPGDDLDPARSDGDLLVQACADDPQVAMHAVRNLTRTAFGTARRPLVAARLRANLVDVDRPGDAAQPVGFKDGTANVKAEETADGRAARLGAAGRRGHGLAGGRLARRRDATSWSGGSGWSSRPGTGHGLREQEAIIGRTKAEGAPLSGGTRVQPSPTSP